MRTALRAPLFPFSLFPDSGGVALCGYLVGIPLPTTILLVALPHTRSPFFRAFGSLAGTLLNRLVEFVPRCSFQLFGGCLVWCSQLLGLMGSGSSARRKRRDDFNGAARTRAGVAGVVKKWSGSGGVAAPGGVSVAGIEMK
jgi:hypothetical protein